MEYPNLVEIKKRLIDNYLRYRQAWDHSLSYVPYRFSSLSIRDALRGIDYAYETAYEEARGEKPSKIADPSAMTMLVKLFSGSDLHFATIANILDYDEEIVRWILTSETASAPSAPQCRQ